MACIWPHWEREVTHCELKADFGVGQNQCRNRRAVVVSEPWRMWVAAVPVLAGYRIWRWFRGPSQPERWWRNAYR